MTQDQSAPNNEKHLNSPSPFSETYRIIRSPSFSVPCKASRISLQPKLPPSPTPNRGVTAPDLVDVGSSLHTSWNLMFASLVAITRHPSALVRRVYHGVPSLADPSRGATPPPSTPASGPPGKAIAQSARSSPNQGMQTTVSHAGHE